MFVVDLKGKVLGRAAAKIATILRGKHKIDFTPHINGGDSVTVINAEFVKVTGDKNEAKKYFTHSGYPHGHKLLSLKDVKKRDSTRIITLAVKGMLPKGPLGRKIIKNLTVYAGTAEVSGKPLNI